MTAIRKALRKIPGLFVSINEIEDGDVELVFTYDDKILGLVSWKQYTNGIVAANPMKLDHLPQATKTYILDYLEAFDKRRRKKRFNP